MEEEERGWGIVLLDRRSCELRTIEGAQKVLPIYTDLLSGVFMFSILNHYEICTLLKSFTHEVGGTSLHHRDSFGSIFDLSYRNHPNPRLFRPKTNLVPS